MINCWSLCQIELWWRRNDAPPPEPCEYEERFPDLTEAVNVAFREFNSRTLYDCLRSADVCEQAKQFGSAPDLVSAIDRRTPLFGDYELLNEIARGGMGVVFKARQRSLDRIVALKMILSGEFADEKEIKRFQAEAESAAKLEHPGIVPVYEFGQQEGRHFFSMGFVEGESLQQRVSSGPFDPKEAAIVCRKVAKAVGYAHDRGVIHRDLKPSNVLIDASGEPKVTDFGLAKRIESDDQLTRTGVVLGTPSFMPPEQALGKIGEIDQRSDVYSLGAVLYSLLTARPPFQSSTAIETVRQTIEREPVPPSRLNPQVPKDIETICLKCLEKDPERRYQSAEELAEELVRFLEGRPILARPVGPSERVIRWSVRNPVVAGMTSVILAFLLAAPFVAVYQFQLRGKAQKAASDLNDANQTLQRQKKEVLSANDALTRRVYENSLVLAKRDIDDGNIRTAREFLEGCPKELRHWEWHRLVRMLDPAIASFDGLNFAQWNKHNELVATAIGSRILIWDIEQGKLKHEMRGDRGDSGLNCASWSPDGNLLAVGGLIEGVCEVWSVSDEKCVFKKKLHESKKASYAVASIEWSPRGDMIASAGASDRRVCVFSHKGIVPVSYLPIEYSGGGFGSISWHPTGRFLAVPTPGKIALWDIDKHEVAIEIPMNSTCVSFSNDGKLIAATRFDENTIKIWRSADGELQLTLPKHPSTITGLRWSPNDRYVVSAGKDSIARIYDVSTGDLTRTLAGHEHTASTGVKDASWHPAGTKVVTCGVDRKLKVWSATSDPSVSTFRASVKGIKWAPSSPVCAVVGFDDSIVLYDSGKSEVAERFPSEVVRTGSEWSSQSIGWNHTGKLLAATHAPGARIIDAQDGESRTIPVTSGDQIMALAWSPTENKILYSTKSGSCVVVDGSSLKTVSSWQTSHTFTFPCVCWHPSGKLVAVTSRPATGRGQEIQVIDSTNGEIIRILPVDHELSVIEWSNDGGMLAASGRTESAITIWNVEANEIVSVIRGHSVAARSIAWSPDDERLASAGTDHTLRIWDPHRGTELLALVGHARGLTSVDWSPEGATVVTGDFRSNVMVWTTRSPRD